MGGEGRVTARRRLFGTGELRRHGGRKNNRGKGSRGGQVVWRVSPERIGIHKATKTRKVWRGKV